MATKTYIHQQIDKITDKIHLLQASLSLIELFKEFKKTREQHTKVGANDSEVNEAIMELMKEAIGSFDDDGDDKLENTSEYWVSCLCTASSDVEDARASSDVEDARVELFISPKGVAAQALQAVAQKIIDCVAGLKMSADELEELYADYA